jgi:hypothetical protein
MMAHRNRFFEHVTYVRHVAEFPTNSSKTKFPPNLSKLGSHKKVEYQKYQPKYLSPSAGADNLPIPARQPVLVKIPAPAPPSTYHTHLSSSTRSTRKKCCVDGLLSSHSPNFNKDAMIKLDMEQFPVFMRLAIHSPNFHEECNTFNNILIII